MGNDTDFGHLLQTDFEAIESAWHCLRAIYHEHKDDIQFEVEINNLGGATTLTEYNQALLSILYKHK